MVREIRSYPLLEGYRGAAASNIESLIDLIHRVSCLATDNPEIVELDLNPVLVFPGNRPCLALDARMRVVRVAAPAAAPAEPALAGSGRR
jgi:acetyltransferase